MRGAVIAATICVSLLSASCLKRGSKDKGDDHGSGITPQAPAPGQPPSPNPSSPVVPPAPPVPTPVDTGPHLDEDKLNTAGDVVDYARFCKQELGLAPKILDSWNCLDGSEVPVTIDGAPLASTNYRDLALGRSGCDLPAWLADEPCANYTFVQKRTLGPDVEGYLLCRMRTFATHKDKAARIADLQRSPTSLEAFSALYEFDSLGLIWTNRRSGKTCFFDFVGKSFGGRVPSPEDPVKPEFASLPDPKPPVSIGPGTLGESRWKKSARETWKAPRDVAQSDNCARCHDSGALKSSPWLAQVMKIGVNDANQPYHVVGKVFDTWRERFPARAISTTKVGSEPQACTSCHRLGMIATCETHLLHAVGHTAPGKLTKTGTAFATRVWMPPPPPEWLGKPESELTALWNTKYDAHLKKMRCCCDNPDAKGCLLQDLDKPALTPPVEGRGPASCE